MDGYVEVKIITNKLMLLEENLKVEKERNSEQEHKLQVLGQVQLQIQIIEECLQKKEVDSIQLEEGFKGNIEDNLNKI